MKTNITSSQINAYQRAEMQSYNIVKYITSVRKTYQYFIIFLFFYM